MKLDTIDMIPISSWSGLDHEMNTAVNDAHRIGNRCAYGKDVTFRMVTRTNARKEQDQGNEKRVIVLIFFLIQFRINACTS